VWKPVTVVNGYLVYRHRETREFAIEDRDVLRGLTEDEQAELRRQYNIKKEGDWESDVG